MSRLTFFILLATTAVAPASAQTTGQPASQMTPIVPPISIGRGGESGATSVALKSSATTLGVGQQAIITANEPVVFSLGGTSGGTLVTVDAEHAIYTAPSSIPIVSPIAGCGSFPNDSIYNTPINSLPVHALSSQWLSVLQNYGLGVEPSFGYNVITNAGYPTLPMKYYYGGSTPAAPLLSWPNKKREGGWNASGSDSEDHHTLMVTTGQNACHFYEFYNDVVSPSTTTPCGDGSNGCNGASGDDYTPTTYGVVTATDAAGLPQYLTLRLDEIKNNAIHHPSRFTLARGYIQSAAAGTPNLWPATGANGWGTIYTPPFGARLRLKADYSVAGKSAYAQNILNSFKQYGLILADSGTTGAIQTGTDIWEDPSVVSAVYQAVSGLSFADFDVVDESGLMINAGITQINPTNGYVVPAGTTQILARAAAGQNPNAVIDLTLVGVGVGLRSPQVSALVTGTSYSYDFGKDAWVTGTTNQSLTWSLVSGPGSVTSYGLYTFPASVAQATQVVLTASSAADPNSQATQYILLYPVSTDGNFRTALGGQFTDDNNNTWWQMAGMEGGILIEAGGDYPWWNSLNGNPEHAIYQSGGYGDNSDLHWQFIVPNGNYNVRFLFGQGYNGCFTNCSLNPSTHVPVAFGVNGQLVAHWYLWGQQVNNLDGVPWDYLAPGQVTNNLMDIWIGKVNPDGETNGSFAVASGMEIMPDNSAPHISIDTGMEGWSAGITAALASPLSVSAGSTQQLYAVGWYMSNSVSWSISGPGSIDPVTGLYTAPAPQPGMPAQTVTVNAISTVDPTKAAAATVVIPQQ